MPTAPRDFDLVSWAERSEGGTLTAEQLHEIVINAAVQSYRLGRGSG
jgi:hypothetical protein